jgi:hypothetical protein
LLHKIDKSLPVLLGTLLAHLAQLLAVVVRQAAKNGLPTRSSPAAKTAPASLESSSSSVKTPRPGREPASGSGNTASREITAVGWKTASTGASGIGSCSAK